MAMMRAAVIRKAGPPEVLKIESIPRPEPSSEQVLIRVRAFGINRSELFTRRGLSSGVHFPRVLGIEAVGEVANAPGGQIRSGEVVATAMAAWVVNSMAATPNMFASPYTKCKPSRHRLAGTNWARSRKCCRPRGVRSSAPCDWRPENGSYSRRNNLGRSCGRSSSQSAWRNCDLHQP
jgi:hypothetical protein